MRPFLRLRRSFRPCSLLLQFVEFGEPSSCKLPLVLLFIKISRSTISSLSDSRLRKVCRCIQSLAFNYVQFSLLCVCIRVIAAALLLVIGFIFSHPSSCCRFLVECFPFADRIVRCCLVHVYLLLVELLVSSVVAVALVALVRRGIFYLHSFH